MFTSVSLVSYRSYDNARYDFSKSITVISGPNGSGKTNILEALYVLCRGSSFRGRDDELVQHGKPWWRIESEWGDTSRIITFEAEKESARKQFIINGVKKQRLMPQMKLPVVLFEPEDLRLLKGSPSRRRTYIDTAISQLEPGYSTYLRRYERALLQRNNLLKQPHVTLDELFSWDVTLSENGAHIIDRRLGFIEKLQQVLQQKYRSISLTEHSASISYSQKIATHTLTAIQQRLMTALTQASAHDLRTGFTSVGPHRDDIVFHLNGQDASATASRGETRSMILAMKLVELELLQQYHTYPPLLLLDDVFSELDITRREGLLGAASNLQTILTTTDAEVISKDIHAFGHIALK